MKILQTKILVLLSLSASVFLSSCIDDDGPSKSKGGKYVVGLRATDGDASVDYIMTHNDLMSDTISSQGNGIEQSGWSYYTSAGNKFFSIGYTLNECIAYTLTDGFLDLDAKFIFERIDCVNAINDDNLMGIGAPWGGGSYDCQLQVINVTDVAITKTVNHPIYESFFEVDSLDDPIQLNAWPTQSFVDGDKMYVSFYPLHGTSWKTPLTDTAYVSVYSYPELAYIKTFKDHRTSNIGYYGGQPCIVTAENGDHYTISSSSFMAGFTQVTKPSGILKINAEELAFDTDYFFNVEEAYGYKILTGTYAGNGKMVARVIDASSDTDISVQWAAFGNFAVFKLVVIDLEAKTLTEINDIPVHHGQYQTPFYKEDGMVYMSMRSAAGTYVYQINAETATAKKGAMIDGIELQGIFRTSI